MHRTFRGVVFGAGLLSLAGAIALGAHQDPSSEPPAAEMPLPPGWTQADMMACVEAGTPGEMHAFLGEGVGVWRGECTAWMAPDVEPVRSECVFTLTPVFDGRYFASEMEGDMGGMPFRGSGLYAFDNVAGEFQSTWIDSFSTGIMSGTGERSEDGKTLTWTYTYHCPITKKPTTIREIDTVTGPNTRTLVMHGVDPKSGREFKMMEIKLTRTAKAASDGAAAHDRHAAHAAGDGR